MFKVSGNYPKGTQKMKLHFFKGNLLNFVNNCQSPWNLNFNLLPIHVSVMGTSHFCLLPGPCCLCGRLGEARAAKGNLVSTMWLLMWGYCSPASVLSVWLGTLLGPPFSVVTSLPDF